MKNKNYYFLLILPLVFIITGCGQKSTDVTNTEGSKKMVEQEEQINSTPLEMLRGGKSLHCTFSYKDGDQQVESTGEFYVDGKKGKFRSEGEVNITGPQPQKIKTYSISDGQYAYSWGSNNTSTGFKVSLDKTTETENTAPDQSVQDLQKPIDFKCRPWTVDSSKFDLPTGIKFTDMDQMLKDLQSSTGICLMCNQIPDAKMKAECQETNCKSN
ncbi:MAG: hypothetical protein WC564_01975 [Patescibacteria group bacterium]|jgi:major membrane immunogen (membrane-anchored lipoprotein)